MNENIDDSQFSKISLKPRFRIEWPEDKGVIVEKFENEFAQVGSKFSGKIVDHHIIIDVPKEEEHFWSPQLHAEVDETEANDTIIKGLFGPKPTVWSLFMFIHFGVALAFLVFLVLLYTRWSLEQDYRFAMLMCISMPILWVVLYFFGRVGKSKGRHQMEQLRQYFFEILER